MVVLLGLVFAGPLAVPASAPSLPPAPTAAPRVATTAAPSRPFHGDAVTADFTSFESPAPTKIESVTPPLPPPRTAPSHSFLRPNRLVLSEGECVRETRRALLLQPEPGSASLRVLGIELSDDLARAGVRTALNPWPSTTGGRTPDWIEVRFPAGFHGDGRPTWKPFVRVRALRDGQPMTWDVPVEFATAVPASSPAPRSQGSRALPGLNSAFAPGAPPPAAP